MTNSPYKCKVKPAFLSFFSAQYSIILMLKIHFYHQPTKLGGSNVFTGVCLSTGGGRREISLVPCPFQGGISGARSLQGVSLVPGPLGVVMPVLRSLPGGRYVQGYVV